MTTILTSREFNQHASEAKKSSLAGPVIITDRGRPSHVLLSFADYKKLTDPEGAQRTIVDLLAMPAGAGDDIEFDPQKADWSLKMPDLA
jgi:prevent-host-death family protein